MVGTLLFRKARRDLGRSRWSFVALTVMVVLGAASFTAIYGGYANLQDAIDRTYDEQVFHDALIEVSPRSASGFSSLTGLEGVASWEARLVVELPVTFAGDRAPVMARVISLPASGPPAINQLRYREGAPPAPGEPAVVVEAAFADHHGLRIGDPVEVRLPAGPQLFEVTGIAVSPEYLWPARTAQEHMPDVLRRWGVLWMGEDQLGRMLNQEGVANQVVIRTAEGTVDGPNEVIRAIGPAEIVRVETRESQASNVALGLLINALNQIAFVLPLLFLAIVGLSTYVVLARLVHQQRANIGLLRALGYSPASVLVHYLSYAPLVAAAGSVIGFVAGYGLSFFVTRLFASYASLAEVGVVWRWDLLGLSIAVSLVFAAFASVLPARHAARLRPAEAMRPPAPPAGGRSPLEYLLPRGTILPASVRMGLRNVGRNPRRAALTILGIGLAVSILVIPQGVINSLNNVVEVAVVRVQRADEVLVFRGPVPTGRIEAAAAVEGVDRLEPTVQLQGNLARAGETYDASIVGLAPTSELVVLYDRADREMAVTIGGIILSRVFERYGFQVGDDVTLYGEVVPIAGFTNASGTTGFVTLETAQRWAGTPGAANMAFLKRSSGASADEVHARLDLPIAASQSIPEAVQDTRDMLRLYYGMVYLILVFGLAIATAIVFNTVTINFLEEVRDFATLRTLGAPTASIVNQTTTETLFVAIPGALLGLGLGAVLTSYFVGVFNSDLFALDTSVRPVTYVVAFFLGTAAALLAQLPSIRQVLRLDLTKSGRERVG